MSDLDDLQIDADAAERCAKACEAFAYDMDAIIDLVNDYDYCGGFGTFPSGRALEKNCTDLTIGGHGSLATMLQAHIDIGRRQADTFTEIGRTYEKTDKNVAETLRPR